MRYIDPTGMFYDGYTVDEFGNIAMVNNEGGEEYDVLYHADTYSEQTRGDYDETGEKGGLIISKGVIQSEKELSIPLTDAGRLSNKDRN